jgi:hypothetical protein
LARPIAVADLASRPRRSRAGPRTLACAQGRRRFTIEVRPGRHVIAVGHKTGKASWDGNAVTLRRGIQITR